MSSPLTYIEATLLRTPLDETALDREVNPFFSRRDFAMVFFIVTIRKVKWWTPSEVAFADHTEAPSRVGKKLPSQAFPVGRPNVYSAAT